MVGLGLGLYGYGLGSEFKDCGCGCCPGVNAVPNFPTLYWWGGFQEVEPMSYGYCELVGCSAPRVPLFLDLYGLAGILMLLGVLKLGSGESGVV